MEVGDFFPMWQKLTEAERESLEQAAFRKHIAAGTVIHDGSMDCMGLLLVQSGQLRAYIDSDEGREITVYRLFERDLCLFSASCIMKSIQFDMTIAAEKDTEVWVIPPEVYRGVMEQSAPLANYTSEIMGSRFTEVMWRIEQILWKSFDRRLAAFLLEEAAIQDSNVLKITHEKIAAHLGTAREVVTRMLKYFQTEGMVKLTRGSIELLDVGMLERMA